jgi:hypothetical protein
MLTMCTAYATVLLTMSQRIKLLLTPTQLEVLYQALHRAVVYEEEMVQVESRHAHEHETNASIYRALTTAVAMQTDIPQPITP